MLRFYLFITCLLLIFSLTACNLPWSLEATLQYGTKAAQSPAAVSVTPVHSTDTPDTALEDTPTRIVTASSTPSKTINVQLTTATRASPSPTVICDRASPGNPLDITISDDTHMIPGQTFTKTWRLVNEGSCTWTQNYAVIYFSGSQMSAVPRSSLPDAVAPGGTVDVSVDMIAPTSPGTYQGNWKLSNPEGHLFGIGPNGDSPFWVRVVVVVEATPTLTLTPVPTQTPTPVIYASGQAALIPGDGLDLDTNTIANPPSGAGDIVYSFGDTKIHRLEPAAGVMFGVPGSVAQPGYQECLDAKLTADPLVLDGLAINSTFCYRTNLGLPGWARLVSLDPKTNLLTLEILTWAIP